MAFVLNHYTKGMPKVCQNVLFRNFDAGNNKLINFTQQKKNSLP